MFTCIESLGRYNKMKEEQAAQGGQAGQQVGPEPETETDNDTED